MQLSKFSFLLGALITWSFFALLKSTPAFLHDTTGMEGVPPAPHSSKQENVLLIIGSRKKPRIVPSSVHAHQAKPSHTAQLGLLTAETAVSRINECAANAALWPGDLSDKPSWSPHKCRLTQYSPEMTAACLASVSYVGIGDSIGEQLSKTIIENLNTTNLPMRYIWSPSTVVPYYLSDRNGKNQVAFLEQSDFVTLSLGAWDIGVHWCGTDTFYDQLKAKVLRYKALLKPSATLLIHNLHYIHPEKCPKKLAWCRTCNPIQKVTVYREIVQMVAACTGLGMIDTYPLTKEGRNFSIDGLHYKRPVVQPKTDILLNMMCGIDGKGNGKLAAWHPNIQCNEEDAKARWRVDPVANKLSEGCPDWANKYGCPGDNGASAERYIRHKKEEELKITTDERVKEDALPFCTRHEELFPGNLVDSRWKPDKCKLHFYTLKEVAKCIKRYPYAAIGDSLGEQLVYNMKRSSEQGPSYTKVVWSPSMQSTNLTTSKSGIDLHNYVTQEVEFAALSFGMWDIGVHWCGLDDFYYKLKEKVLKYKRMLKPTARLVIHNLHNINTIKSDLKWVRMCNPQEKVRVYREMLQMASVCTGVGMVDTYPLTMKGEAHTHDGVHYDEPVIRPKVNMLMNMMCGPHLNETDRLKPWFPPVACDESAALARWKQVKEAVSFSPGCPDYQNDMGCTNDNGAALRRFNEHIGALRREARKAQNEKVQDTRERCLSGDDLYPGSLEKHGWVPSKCSLHQYTAVETYECLAAKPFVAIGDSIGEQVFNMLRRRTEASGRFVMGKMVPLKLLQEPTAHHLPTDDEFLVEAKFASLSMGMWDAGPRWCGAEVFYEAMKKKVLFYKSKLPKSAPLILQNMHHIDDEKCSALCPCYTPKRIAVFREVIDMVGACTGSPVLDVYNVTLAAETNTQDGFHYGSKVQNTKADLLLNMVCGVDGNKGRLLRPPAPRVSCSNEAASIARWKVEEGGKKEGCTLDLKYKCPEKGSV
eukprot:TRINITY_DN9802_c0_g1_i1.p1 TRINITY_DN9802_c0_g1~~TRINITY_DN9802_c0_g1_i1.p1  ORF type:complete len:984 (+),score=173.94 TRINITY_DN9802_c0_g1_i1:57-3008(+)